MRSNLLRNCRGATSWCSPQHAATVGLLLCTDKNDRVVRYSLATSNQPMAIASYDLLTPTEQAAPKPGQGVTVSVSTAEALAGVGSTFSTGGLMLATLLICPEAPAATVAVAV